MNMNLKNKTTLRIRAGVYSIFHELKKSFPNDDVSYETKWRVRNNISPPSALYYESMIKPQLLNYDSNK